MANLNKINFINYTPVKSAIVLYLILILLILIWKPRGIFDENGNSKLFGVGYKYKTLLPLWLLFILIAIICYYFVIIIKIFY